MRNPTQAPLSRARALLARRTALRRARRTASHAWPRELRGRSTSAPAARRPRHRSSPCAKPPRTRRRLGGPGIDLRHAQARASRPSALWRGRLRDLATTGRTPPPRPPLQQQIGAPPLLRPGVSPPTSSQGTRLRPPPPRSRIIGGGCR